MSLETIIQARLFELDYPARRTRPPGGAGGSVLPWGSEPPAGLSQSDEITVKLKAIIIVASLLAATAAHADTIYLKCWAQGLAGDQLTSVYINEQVTINLDEKTMHSWTFGSNLAVHVTDRHLLFETAPTLGNMLQNLFRDPTAVWQGFINRVDGTLMAHKRDGTVIRGHCQEQPKRLF